MFKKHGLIFFLLLLHFGVNAQNTLVDSKKIDSLKYVLTNAKDDATRIKAMGGLGFNYQNLNIDSALKYTQTGIDLARQIKSATYEANLLATLSGIMSQQGKFADALDLLFKSLKIAEDNDLPYDIARANRRLGGVYFDLENYNKAIAHNLRALAIDEENKFKNAGTDHVYLAKSYEKINDLDAATFHAEKALKEKDFLIESIQDTYRLSGDIEIKRGHYQKADSLFRLALKYATRNVDLFTFSETYYSLSNMFLKLNEKDSALFYALKGFEYSNDISYKKGIIVSGNMLAELYDSLQPAISLKYFKIVAAAKDSLFGAANIQTIQNLVAREEAKQKELEDAKKVYRNKLNLFGLLIGLVVLLIISLILYRNNRNKQKANKQLEQQKETLQKTLSELKSAQALLIQSEKMASLGELTAGIAHEIQNPLNFVNNFSEVSNEMIKEIQDERRKTKDQRDETLTDEILNDIEQNLEKINHHGKRAGDIVKGMLQHSRVGSGKKEPTDINALCDEYLRLAYHGLRAKDKSFNASMNTDFDESLEKINVIPQDIGRVVLNLITNAFYAVNERLRQAPRNDRDKQPDSGYQPTVTVSTKHLSPAGGGKGVVISVKDNGNGIPEHIKEKIFQPFFTTKPTGQGTGLGLSLSYDIVKSHGGELRVETRENEGSEFVIQLPIVKAHGGE